MREALSARRVEADIVGCPPVAELVAAHRQLADEFGEVAVVGVAAGLGAKAARGGVGDAVPVPIEDVCTRVEEDEARKVDRALGIGKCVGVQSEPQTISGQDVEARIAYERGTVADGVEDVLHPWAYLLGGWTTVGGALFGSVHDVEQVGALDVVQLEGAGDGIEDVVGDATNGAALELGVVLDTDPGEHGHLFAAQPLHATAAPVGAQPGLGRRDSGAAGGEELADLVPGPHVAHRTAALGPEGGAASTPIDIVSLAPARGFTM